MAKNCLVMLVLVAVVTGGAFAQSDMPMNTVTVDIGPTIIGLAISGVGDMIGEEGVSSTGFGLAAQYERQLSDKLSVGGRFAYLGAGLGFAPEENGVKAKIEANIHSFSVEGHARYYPFAGAFFLDGMLGYALMSATLSGNAWAEGGGNSKQLKSVSFTGSRHYIKTGAKIGWRIDFGDPGGFTFEPSFGYSLGFGLGDTIGKKLSDDIGENVKDLDDMFFYLEDLIFIGGPRVSLAFGWRF